MFLPVVIVILLGFFLSFLSAIPEKGRKEKGLSGEASDRDSRLEPRDRYVSDLPEGIDE